MKVNTIKISMKIVFIGIFMALVFMYTLLSNGEMQLRFF